MSQGVRCNGGEKWSLEEKVKTRDHLFFNDERSERIFLC